MRSEFPLREKQTEFGPLPDPKIVLPVKTSGGYKDFRFLLDTGADFTMLPFTMADELGVDIENAPEVTVTGIKREEVRARLAEVTVRIGEVEVELSCLYCMKEDMPYLLGRMGLFQRFNIAFDNRRKRIVFESI